MTMGLVSAQNYYIVFFFSFDVFSFFLVLRTIFYSFANRFFSFAQSGVPQPGPENGHWACRVRKWLLRAIYEGILLGILEASCSSGMWCSRPRPCFTRALESKAPSHQSPRVQARPRPMRVPKVPPGTSDRFFLVYT